MIHAYLVLVVSLIAVATGLLMMLVPRQFNRLYWSQLRGLVDVERTTNLDWLSLLMQRAVGFVIASMSGIFTWAALRFIKGGTGPGRTSGIPLNGTTWLTESIMGIVLSVIAVIGLFRPELLVRMFCKYCLLLGEPRAEKLADWRVGARVSGTIALLAFGTWAYELLRRVVPW